MIAENIDLGTMHRFHTSQDSLFGVDLKISGQTHYSEKLFY